ncbi:MAG: exodeoxyribonuclease V subunit gamma, partial [Gammaproteobacteria bacterium]|nr:exodeoxyribonuclease V subunit gamma [Gammaproteobacteria bacterium]
QPLQHYLRDDSDDLKRWQLSARIADVLDRYQFYRPALIRQWSCGEGDDWQALLWRELIADLGDSHRVAVLDRLLQRLQKGTSIPLPERISLFALSTLPPLFVDVLHALAAHPSTGEIDLYLHSPTDQYWADLKSKKALSRLRMQSPDTAVYFDTGNELLASWGRQGQALQDLLLNHDDLQAAEWEDYRPPAADSLLHHIQQDIFNLDQPPTRPTADGSVQLHICHSPLRECQVLHDQLLRALDADSTLKPEDILIMVPEISRYAPFIEAVFRKDESGARPFIPWNLSDISIADEHPLIRIFFQLLTLPESRFSHSEVMSYLDVPELSARFGLDAVACEAIREMLDEAEVRWGLDAEHKRELGLPGFEQNTWRQAGQRLFAGYALGVDDDWQDIAPLAVAEGDKAIALGRFWQLFERLRDYRRELSHERSAGDWQRLLNRLLEDFFSEHDDDGKLQQIRDSLDELHQQADEQILSSPLLRHWLDKVLGQQTLHGRYFSGGVTFCGMRPMRSLPFRVICLLGMNDQAFPRREQALEFDGMADQWRPGDPRKGDEDRYLLLETLLCTRQMLYISYTGRDMKDNGERQPSVLVHELLDFMDSRYPLAAGEAPISKRITRLHPLQPFSPRNYAQNDASYDRYWCRVATAIQGNAEVAEAQDWPGVSLPLADGERHDIELKSLRRFLAHPVKYFFNQRLRIYLQETAQNEDEEPFALDGLQRWAIKSRLLDDFLQGRATRTEQLRARGLLPHGVFSEISLVREQQEVAPLMETLKGFVGGEFSPRPVDIACADGFRLGGQIERYLPGCGVLHVSASKLKGKALLGLWLDHLALCASERLTADEGSTLVCRDAAWRFAVVPAVTARAELQQYVDIYWQGLQRPLPVFPDASHAWAMKRDDAEKAMKAAAGKWAGNRFQNIPGDQDDVYIQLALRGLNANPLACTEFTELATALYATALNHGEAL